MFRYALQAALVLAALVLAAPPQTTQAQQQPVLRFDRLTVEQGLSSNHVTGLHQDRQGFLWIGTQGGLNRYDGYTFTVYKHAPADPQSLSHNRISSLSESRTGHLWIGTAGGGLNRLDPTTGQFTRYRHDPANPGSLSDDHIRCLYEDPQGQLWIGTAGGGLNRLDPATGQFTRYQHDPADNGSLLGDEVAVLHEDHTGTLWVASAGHGLNALDKATGRVTRYPYDPANPGGLSSPYVVSIQQHAGGALWLGFWRGGIGRFDPATGRLAAYRHNPDDPRSLSDDRVRRMMIDRAGVIWVATTLGGLNRLDPAEGRFTHYRHSPGDPYSLSDSDVIALTQDHAGVLWFGTWRGGLNRLDPHASQFAHYRHDPGDAAGLDNNEVTALHVDRAGALWVGTWSGGLSRLDPATGQFTRYRHDPDDPRSLREGRILALHEDPTQPGTLWIGTWTGTLSRLDTATGRFTHYRHDPDDAYSQAHGGISALYTDRAGALWVGSDGGLSRRDPVTGRFTRYQHNPADDGSLSFNGVRALYQDRRGDLWVGTADGLNRFDAATGTFTRYRFDADDPASLSSNQVTALYEDQAGRLWIGTTMGLDLLDRATGRFVHHTPDDGLPNEVIHGIEEDRRGRLWLSTDHGLARFDPSTGDVAAFDVTDGLQGLQFSRAHARGPDGVLYFGGGNGFNAFHPERIRTATYAPTVAFTHLHRHSLDPATTRPDRIPAPDAPVVLPHTEQAFSVSFAAVNDRAPQKNRYAYRLEDRDGDDDSPWVDLGTQRRLTFTGLAPGTYRLHVRASNSSHLWNGTPATLQLTILPPWWRTGWAYLLYAAGIVALLLSLRRYDLHRLRLRERLDQERIATRKLRELDEAKSRFFTNISHEFRTPLTLIIGPLQHLLQTADGLPAPARTALTMMLRNARRLQRLINQILDLSKLEAGQMTLHRQTHDLNAFVRQTVTAMQPLAERRCITLTPPLAAPCHAAFDAGQMEKVLGNLLSNALKFTPEHGRVDVLCRRGGADHAEIVVRDTGVGIAPDHLRHIFDRFYQVDASITRSHEGTGIGLALVHDLVALHHGTIAVESTLGEGTTFTVALPLATVPTPLRGDGRVADQVPDLALPPKPAPPTLHPAEVSPKDQTTVLVVDDNADLRIHLQTLLQPHYRVLIAQDGQEGLDHARRHLPDLILADVMMPRLDGFGLSRALKDDAMLEGIPVILLTARADVQSQLTGLAAEVDRYLMKPFEPSVLLAQVRNVLALRGRLLAHLQRTPPADTPTALPEAAASPFEAEVRAVVAAHLGDGTFDVQRLAAELALSPSWLRRRFRSEIGTPPNRFIRQIRLERAAALLRTRAGTISEVAFAVGFNSLAYFDRCYRAHYGAAPSEHLGADAREA